MAIFVAFSPGTDFSGYGIVVEDVLEGTRKYLLGSVAGLRQVGLQSRVLALRQLKDGDIAHMWLQALLHERTYNRDIDLKRELEHLNKLYQVKFDISVGVHSLDRITAAQILAEQSRKTAVKFGDVHSTIVDAVP